MNTCFTLKIVFKSNELSLNKIHVKKNINNRKTGFFMPCKMFDSYLAL